MAAEPLHIWMVTDGKAGHENQLLGLSSRVGARVDARAHRVEVGEAWAALPGPDLILCAGRRTHRDAARAKRERGGRLVVCMRPSVSPAAFDLCLIPRHDRPRPAANVEETIGAMVAVRPGGAHEAARGLVMIGGPSKHYGFDGDAVVRMVRTIAEREGGVRWDVTTSRRTPEGVAEALVGLGLENLAVSPGEATPRGWVGEKLAASGSAWVTEDSVSMVCEAATAGCSVGVLPGPRKGAVRKGGRVARCVDDLRSLGHAVGYADWLGGRALEPGPGLDEADRCAGVIVERFFADRDGS